MQGIKTRNVAKIFLISLIVCGILSGIIYYNLQSEINQNLIIGKIQNITSIINTTHQNIILTHLISIIILIFLSYTIIGIPIILFYLFYQCTSIGFLLASFYATHKLKGILFAIIFTIISKSLYIIFILIICYISLKIAKKMIRVLIFKENDSLYLTLKGFLLKLFIIVLAVILYDIFLYFFANKILSIFIFLLK